MILTEPRPATLTPTNDPAPVVQAVVDGIVANHEPETFLWIVFHQPDGGAHVRYAWTTGGPELGNHTDDHALAAGLDAADWLHIVSRHRHDSTRGRVEVHAHPLRPVLADVQAGLRSPGDHRAAVRRILRCYLDDIGQHHLPDAPPRWMGVGPTLVARTR
ncbi:hypothetical protein [Streptomyces sp. URMC 124]|uniref:hypothetical protein n=1 Tax=Streptomyces sp. URMC 124 TaxID=3423405 RepID=UPI003F1B3F61